MSKHSDRAAADAARRTSRYKPRVLLVEDEAFAALDLALTLQAVGYEVLGPCRTVEEARDAAVGLHPDAAVLDIDLGGEARGFDVAGILHDADIPFVFVSSHQPAALPLPLGLRDRPRLLKPLDPRVLLASVEALLET